MADESADIVGVENQKLASDPGLNLDPDVALKKCIAILNAAKTDNEHFAGLLLVTQLVQSNKIDSKGRRLLFESIGFSFINRLLCTKSVPCDCPTMVYKSLAVTILACFATDEELLFHPQFTSKISFFLEVISSSEGDKSIFEEVSQILSTFASSEAGCEHLLRRKAVKVLCEILTKARDITSSHYVVVMEILKKILYHCPQETWKVHGDSLLEFVVSCSEKFKECIDLSKFTLCEDLTSLIITADKSFFEKALEKHKTQNKIKSNIKAGLREILQSKVKEEQRNIALTLTSAVSEIIGIEWMVEKYDDDLTVTSFEDDFLILVLSLVNVEVNMIINHTQHEQMTNKLSLTSVCYSILEKAIGFMSGCLATEEDIPSLQSILTKAYTITSEALSCVTAYLLRVAANQHLSEIKQADEEFLYGSVRLLCSWIAEETVALQQEIIELLPFLLELAEKSFKPETQENGTCCEERRVRFNLPQDDLTHKMAGMNMAVKTKPLQKDQPRVITFLLPGLCHLSADEKTRKVLIEKKAHDLLFQYFKFVYEKWIDSKMEDDLKESRLCLLFGIFLNFAVTESDLIGSDDTFISLRCFIVDSTIALLNEQHKHEVLVANMVVLGLLLLRQQIFSEQLNRSSLQQTAVKSFFDVVVEFLRSVVKVTWSDQPNEFSWSTIAELWLLGMDLLVASLKTVKVLREVLTNCGWIKEIRVCLSDHSARRKLPQDVVEAFEKLVKEIG